MRSSLRGRMARVLAAGALTAAMLLPAGPVAAAEDGPVVLRTGLTQSLDSTNPYDTALVVRLRGVRADVRPAHELRPGSRANPRASPSRGRGPRTASPWHLQDPRGHEVVRWDAGHRARTPASATRSNLDAIAAEAQRRPRVHRPGCRGLRRHRGRVPGRHDDDHDDLGSVGPALPELRPDPAGAHLRRQGPTSRSARRSSTRRWSAPARTSSRNGRRASSPASSGTRTTGAPRAPRTRSSCSSSVPRTPWSRRCIAGEIDYARAMNADQFDLLKSNEEVTEVEGTANGWTELGFNTYGSGTGNTIEGGGPSTHGAPGPGLPRRARLRRRQARTPRSHRRWLRHARDDRWSRRPWRQWHEEPDDRPHVRPHPCRAEARGRRLRRSMRRAPGSTRTASRSA